MIKFGSRTEVYLPAGGFREALVRPGDKVRGGSTVLLRSRRPIQAAPATKIASHTTRFRIQPQ